MAGAGSLSVDQRAVAGGHAASIRFDQFAENEVDNATSCRAWQAQALGWREFYAGQQVAINGKAGDWAARAPADAAQAPSAPEPPPRSP